MKFGILYDLKDDYSFKKIESKDFTELEEVLLLSNLLTELGHKVELIHCTDDFFKDLNFKKNTYDLLINMTEGYDSRNREALVPALMELLDIPCIGSDCYASNITLDKHLTKLIAEECGIPTPRFSVYIHKYDTYTNKLPQSKYLVIKPIYGGSSDGVLRVNRNDLDLSRTIKSVSKKFNQNILIEEYVSGCDVSVAAYGNTKFGYRIIGGVEILDKDNRQLLLYDKAYKDSYNVVKIAPRWTNETRNQVYCMCEQLAKVIELSGFFRFDFKIKDGKINFLEINSVPSLLPDGSFIKAIEVNNLTKKDIFRGVLESENIKIR